MFVYYNIIWIICLILLFASLFLLFRRQRAIRGRLVASPPGQSSQFVIVDMNGRPPRQSTYPATYAPPPPQSSSSQPQTFYRPPESSVEPPPPSYQDYSKDYRVPHIQ